MVNQQVIRGDLKRERVVGIATPRPTPSAGMRGLSGNMLLLLESAPLPSDPGPCPCLSGFLFDTKSSKQDEQYCIKYRLPAGGGCHVAPVSAARQHSTSSRRIDMAPNWPRRRTPETAGPSSSALRPASNGHCLQVQKKKAK